VAAETLLERAAQILRKIGANAPLAVRFSIDRQPGIAGQPGGGTGD
jgi:hypothetical protein